MTEGKTLVRIRAIRSVPVGCNLPATGHLVKSTSMCNKHTVCSIFLAQSLSEAQFLIKARVCRPFENIKVHALTHVQYTSTVYYLYTVLGLHSGLSELSGGMVTCKNGVLQLAVSGIEEVNAQSLYTHTH